MKALIEKRLKKEIQERVIMNDGDLRKSFQDVQDRLFNEYELLMDNDRLLQAIGVKKDMNVLNEMIYKYNTLEEN